IRRVRVADHESDREGDVCGPRESLAGIGGEGDRLPRAIDSAGPFACGDVEETRDREHVSAYRRREVFVLERGRAPRTLLTPRGIPCGAPPKKGRGETRDTGAICRLVRPCARCAEVARVRRGGGCH